MFLFYYTYYFSSVLVNKFCCRVFAAGIYNTMALLYNRMNNPLDVFYSQLALSFAEDAKATYEATEAHVCCVCAQFVFDVVILLVV